MDLFKELLQSFSGSQRFVLVGMGLLAFVAVSFYRLWADLLSPGSRYKRRLEVLKLWLEVHNMAKDDTPDAITKLKDEVKVQIYEAFKRRQRKPLIAANSKLGRWLQWLIQEKPNKDRVISGLKYSAYGCSVVYVVFFALLFQKMGWSMVTPGFLPVALALSVVNYGLVALFTFGFWDYSKAVILLAMLFSLWTFPMVANTFGWVLKAYAALLNAKLV